MPVLKPVHITPRLHGVMRKERGLISLAGAYRSVAREHDECPAIFLFPSLITIFFALVREKSNNRFFLFLLDSVVIEPPVQLMRSDRRTVVSVVLISSAIITSPSSFCGHTLSPSTFHDALKRWSLDSPWSLGGGGRDSVGETNTDWISRINYSASSINCDTTAPLIIVLTRIR